MGAPLSPQPAVAAGDKEEAWLTGILGGEAHFLSNTEGTDHHRNVPFKPGWMSSLFGRAARQPVGPVGAAGSIRRRPLQVFRRVGASGDQLVVRPAGHALHQNRGVVAFESLRHTCRSVCVQPRLQSKGFTHNPRRQRKHTACGAALLVPQPESDQEEETGSQSSIPKVSSIHQIILNGEGGRLLFRGSLESGNVINVGLE